MTDTAHVIYAASVRQLNGVIAERDALAAALAAKAEQVAGLLDERKANRAEIAYWQRQARHWRRAFSGEEYDA